jgi:hypothetical protein
MQNGQGEFLFGCSGNFDQAFLNQVQMFPEVGGG